MGKVKKIAIGFVVVIVIFVGLIVLFGVTGYILANSSNDIEPKYTEQKSIDSITLDPVINQEEISAWANAPELLPSFEELGEDWGPSKKHIDFPRELANGDTRMCYRHEYYKMFCVTVSQGSEFVGKNPYELPEFIQYENKGQSISSPDKPQECAAAMPKSTSAGGDFPTTAFCIKNNYLITIADVNDRRYIVDMYGPDYSIRYMKETDFKGVLYISDIIMDKMN